MMATAPTFQMFPSTTPTFSLPDLRVSTAQIRDYDGKDELGKAT